MVMTKKIADNSTAFFMWNMPYALWLTACGRFLLRLGGSVFIMVAHEPVNVNFFDESQNIYTKKNHYFINIPSQY
jgi:hypothetical protein